MKLENDYLDALPYLYVVAVGRITGIFGEWSTAEKQVTGYKNPIHKGFNNKQAAIEYLVFQLTQKSKERVLSSDEMETFVSAQAILESFPPEPTFPSLI